MFAVPASEEDDSSLLNAILRQSGEASKGGREGGEEIHVIFPLLSLFRGNRKAKARKASRTTSPSMNYAARGRNGHVVR